MVTGQTAAKPCRWSTRFLAVAAAHNARTEQMKAIKTRSAPGDNTPQKHRNLREPWKQGQSGNPHGRPKGSKNKLSEIFIGDLYSASHEHGRAAIDAMIDKNP